MVLNPSLRRAGPLIRFIGRTAPIAIAAIGQYFVIVSGEFDLSMGAVVATQVVIAGNLIGQDEARSSRCSSSCSCSARSSASSTAWSRRC